MSFIGVDPAAIAKIQQLQAKLAKMPKEVGEAAARAGADETVKFMRSYPAQGSITRVQAYGVPFFTDRQRRFFFAALKDGRIGVPYRRTGTLRDHWTIIGQGLTEIVVNQAPYAGLVMGNGEQNRMHQKLGWKTVETRMREGADKLLKAMKSAADRAIRKLGL